MTKYYKSDAPLNPNYPKQLPTVYKALRDAGYHTMTSGKDDLTKQHHNLFSFDMGTLGFAGD